MTTKAELKKYAKQLLTPQMIAKGFKLTPKSYAYMRQRGDIWHFVIPEFNADNSSMRWVVTAWVPEIGLQPYDLANLPNEVSICTGGRLGKAGPSWGSYDLWPAATADECAASFPLVLRRLDEVGIPWLDRITTREDLVRHINPSSAVDRFGNKTADKVYGRNLLYRDQVKPIGS